LRPSFCVFLRRASAEGPLACARGDKKGCSGRQKKGSGRQKIGARGDNPHPVLPSLLLLSCRAIARHLLLILSFRAKPHFVISSKARNLTPWQGAKKETPRFARGDKKKWLGESKNRARGDKKKGSGRHPHPVMSSNSETFLTSIGTASPSLQASCQPVSPNL
jgi:hypothetical protein